MCNGRTSPESRLTRANPHVKNHKPEVLALAASLLLFGCVAHKSLAVVRTLGRNSKAREEVLPRVLRVRAQQAGLRLLLLLLLLLLVVVAVVGTGTGE